MMSDCWAQIVSVLWWSCLLTPACGRRPAISASIAAWMVLGMLEFPGEARALVEKRISYKVGGNVSARTADPTKTTFEEKNWGPTSQQTIVSNEIDSAHRITFSDNAAGSITGRGEAAANVYFSASARQGELKANYSGSLSASNPPVRNSFAVVQIGSGSISDKNFVRASWADDVMFEWAGSPPGTTVIVEAVYAVHGTLVADVLGPDVSTGHHSGQLYADVTVRGAGVLSPQISQYFGYASEDYPQSPPQFSLPSG